MKQKIWLAVQIASYLAFFACIALARANMLGDHRHVNLGTAGSLGILVSAFIGGVACSKRRRDGDIYY